MAWGMVAGAAISVVGGAMLADDAGAQGANDASAAANRQQAEIAKEQWDRWKQMYAPLEEDYISESRGLGSSANQNHNAQQAAADVASGFSKVREQLNDVPVNSPDAKLREQNRINLAEAATSAAAQSGARESTRAAGRAGMTDAISLGRNLPAQASTGLAAASSGMAAAARYAQDRADRGAAGFGKMVGGITQSKGFQDWMNKPSGGMISGGGFDAGGFATAGSGINPSSGEFLGSLEF